MTGFDAGAAAQVLLAARRSARPADGLTPPPGDTAAAYAVQEAVLAGLGDPGGLWKMALLGGADRECAVLPGATLVQSGALLAVPADARIEVETAILLAADPGPEAAEHDILRAIAAVHLAFELVAPRLAPQADLPPLARMADSFSSAGVVLGSKLAKPPADRLGIELELDGKPVATTEAAAPLADALDFLRWLSGHARRQGRDLKAGDVIITGARIGPLPLNGARHARATAAGACVELRLADG
ncbi:MAG: hydratase [Paracoccus sp. BP8]|nr:MAG: hydratase [Paracoccus sp. BP8]